MQVQGGQQQRAKVTGRRMLAMALSFGSDVKRAASLKSEDPASGGNTDSEGDSLATDGGSSKCKQGGRKGDIACPDVHVHSHKTACNNSTAKVWQLLHKHSAKAGQFLQCRQRPEGPAHVLQELRYAPDSAVALRAGGATYTLQCLWGARPCLSRFCILPSDAAFS